MMETARDYEIQLPRIEGLTPSEALPLLFGTIKECLEQISSLREENRVLREENRVLREENRELKEEVKELKSRLNMDSHNSSKPPSSDGFKKKTKSLRSHSGKTSGGQPGYNGNNLKLESPDDTKHLPVDECAGCKCSLKDQELSGALRVLSTSAG